MIDKDFLEKLKNKINCKNNKELAAEFDVSYNTLATWIQREAIPFEVIFKTVKKYNLSLDELFELEKKSKKEMTISEKIDEIQEKLENLKKTF